MGAGDGEPWQGKVRVYAANGYFGLVPCSCPAWRGVNVGVDDGGWPRWINLPLQLSLEFIEEAPVGALGDNLLGT